MIVRSLFLAAVAVAAPASARPDYGPQDLLPNAPYIAPLTPKTIVGLTLQNSAKLRAFHDEGLAIQRADGGTLTPEHRAALQAKLDRLVAEYRRSLHRADPWAVVRN